MTPNIPSDLRLLRPVAGRFPVTARFGEKAPCWKTQHYGVDFGCPDWTPVLAAYDGRVKYRGYEEQSGYVVVLAHEWGETRYCHLTDWSLSELPFADTQVAQGQHIAYSGHSGTRIDGVVMPSHLHFGAFDRDGEPFNPEPFFARGPFPDVMPASWAADAIWDLAKEGIMVGDTQGKFRPKDPVTREEVAVLAWRLKNLISLSHATMTEDLDKLGGAAADTGMTTGEGARG